MKRLSLVIALALLPLAGTARAEDKAAEKPAAEKAEKPDCSAQKTALEDAQKAAKAKPDYSSCNDKKGKEKSECMKPLKEKAKEDAKAAKEKVAEAKKAHACCMNPKKKGCS